MNSVLPEKSINFTSWDSKTTQNVLKASLATSSIIFLAGVILGSLAAASFAIPIALPIALCSLGSISALTSFIFIAIKGHSDAQFELAKKYDEGTDETLADASKANELYSSAAAFGHTQAQYVLAMKYELDTEKAENEVKAFELYTVAAKANHPAAQFRLARCYFNGRGCPINQNKALELLKKAADSGLTIAKADLANHYLVKQKLQENVIQGFNSLKELSDNDFFPAQHLLADFYFNQNLSEIKSCDSLTSSQLESYEMAHYLFNKAAHAETRTVEGLTPAEIDSYFEEGAKALDVLSMFDEND